MDWFSQLIAYAHAFAFPSPNPEPPTLTPTPNFQVLCVILTPRPKYLPKCMAKKQHNICLNWFNQMQWCASMN